MLLLLCFLPNITTCTTALLGEHIFERKALFATTLFEKGGGLIFEGGSIFEGLRIGLRALTNYEKP